MKAGLPTDAQVQQDGSSQAAGEGSAETSPGPGFAPPEPAELAEQCPHLEILELLGQGGMGAVYKARQKQLDRLVALKILPPQVSQTEAFAERFTREARSLAKLNHPHIVIVHDFGKTEAGLYYFIMEFVDGTDLRQVMRTQQLSPAEALAIVPQICEALQFAHDEGIVHRDIKPENVLLDKKGRVKIADFGLAKLLGRPATVYTLTQAGQRMGTPQYMAPEQIEHPDQVDHRADIYSLGVVFYEMLTGELPLGRFAPPSRKVHVDVRLDEVVLKTLEKEPELRYQQASEVQTEVETISSQGQAEQPAGKGPVAPGDGQIGSIRQRVWIPAAGLLVAGAINLLGLSGMFLAAIVWFFRGGAYGQESFFGFIPGAIEVIIVAAVAAYCVVIIAGAWNLLQLRSYRLAVVGAAAAVLPFFPGAVLGIPMGIWALVLLSKEEVKAAFGGRAADMAIPPKIRKFAASATKEIKVAFDQSKAEIKKVMSERSAETQDSDTAARGKSLKMAIASFVLTFVSALIASLDIGFAMKFTYGFLTVSFAVFLGVMAIRNITSYRDHLLHKGFAVAAIFFASLGLIRLLAAIF
jgi:tRNA A-37 threonylcarbamoyl transferase component Bud32